MKVISTLLLMPVLFLFSGCVPSELVFRELPEDPAAPVTVAAFLPLTGNNRIYAEQMKEGLSAAETRINALTGISGRKLKVQYFDTAGSAEGTRNALEQAQDAGAIAAVAGYDTGEVSMLISHADRLRMPMVIPLATSDYHTQTSSFVYRNCFTDLQQMEMLAAYIFYWRKVSKGAIITDLDGDEEYTRGISRNFTQAINDQGGTIVGTVTLKPDSTLSEEQIRYLLMNEPNFIMLSARGKRVAQMIKSIREAGFIGIICGPDSWDDSEVTDALQGIHPGECIFTAFFSEENSNREFKAFRKEFRRNFYHYPGACETQSYDALVFLAIALNNAENLLEFDRNWCTIKNYPGAAAIYTMQKKGNIDRTIYLKSFGVEKSGGTLHPFARLSKKLQYSKLKDYQVIE